MEKRNHFHRFQQKRYSRGVYRNPYFNAQKKPTPTWFIRFGIGIILFVFLFGYLFSYPAFTIKRIEITGLESSSNELMNSAIRAYLNKSKMLFFHNTNTFLFSEREFKDALLSTFAFDQISVKRKKQIVSISVKERTLDIIWKSGSDIYLADMKGVITQKISEHEMKTLPIFLDKNTSSVSIGDHVLNENLIKHILEFQKTIQGFGMKTQEVQIDLKVGKWIGLLTMQGYLILFDPDQDVILQSNRLKSLVLETLKDQSKLQYIDLRFGDHVYYK